MVIVRPKGGSRAGFTLVELLVVIVIIGILAGLLIPVIVHAIHEGQIAGCASNLSQLGKTTAVYRSMYRGRVPTEKGQAFWLAFQKTTPPLISPTQNEVFWCQRKGEVGAWGGTDYRGPAVPYSKVDQGGPVGADQEGNHGNEQGGNVLREDGSVQRYAFDEAVWTECRRQLIE